MDTSAVIAETAGTDLTAVLSSLSQVCEFLQLMYLTQLVLVGVVLGAATILLLAVLLR